MAYNLNDHLSDGLLTSDEKYTDIQTGFFSYIATKRNVHTKLISGRLLGCVGEKPIFTEILYLIIECVIGGNIGDEQNFVTCE